MQNERQNSAQARPLEPDVVGRRESWKSGDGPYITKEEFQTATGGERLAAIGLAMGAASTCWESPEKAGEFLSDIVCQIGQDLASYLDVEPNMSAEEASWLLVLVQNAIPRSPNDPSTNWEGAGRLYAEGILSRIANSGPSDLEKRHMALITELKNTPPGIGRFVSAEWILEQLGENES